ncbi:MAG: DUF6152 family protein [Pseudohongiellaceae bacterium]|jgi:Family of unknown function (DUF6152)
MRFSLVKVVGLAFGIAFFAIPATAHHAFSTEFDSTKPIRLVGKITQMEWINPHSWLHLDVVKEDGTVESWMVEAGPAGVLVRRGWTKNSIVPGTEVIVEGYLARDGSQRANGRDVTLPDGQRLFAGSSAPDAPLE